MATKPVSYCDKCDKPAMEVGAMLSPFKDSAKELCFQCASGELQMLYGISATSNGAASAPNGDGLTDKERARAKRRSELETEHGTIIYVAKPTEPVEIGKVIQHKAGEISKNIEIIEGVHDEPGLWFVKVVV